MKLHLNVTSLLRYPLMTCLLADCYLFDSSFEIKTPNYLSKKKKKVLNGEQEMQTGLYRVTKGIEK